MSCGCKGGVKTSGADVLLDKYTKVQIIVDFLGIFVGKNTGTSYGPKATNQTFYVLEQDVEDDRIKPV